MGDPTPEELFTRRLGENRDLIGTIREDADLMRTAAELATAAATAFAAGNKLMLFGNGGSAADSVHIAAEFVGRYLTERRPLPAISLAANISALTAIGNDYGFDQIFARQVEALGAPGDVAIGLSTSGNSANVVAGLEQAAAGGMRTFAMTGEEPRAVGEAAEKVIAIPSAVTPNIQQGHMLIAHVACEWVERELVAGEF